jgi:hypothetical protein
MSGWRCTTHARRVLDVTPSSMRLPGGRFEHHRGGRGHVMRTKKQALANHGNPVGAPAAVAPLCWACPLHLRRGGLGHAPYALSVGGS